MTVPLHEIHGMESFLTMVQLCYQPFLTCFTWPE